MISINGKEFKYDFFPDGTLKILDFHFTSNSVGVGHIDIKWKFDSLIEQIVLENLVNHLRDWYYINSINLVLPYIPNARMDRTKNKYQEIFTLKYFADFINRLNFNMVIVEDPHSYVATSLINRSYSDPELNMKIHKCIKTVQPDIVFLPDEGANKRYDIADVQTAFGIKKRDWKTGELSPIQIIGDIPQDAKALIIDDICSYGGTFIRASQALKDAGAREVYLYITHCENSILKGDLLKGDTIEHVYTTDSIYRGEHEKVTVIN